MILNDLLSSDGFTPVNKKLSKDLGFIVAGYFGELIRQRKRFGQEEFYFSQSQMIEEIGISEYEQRQSVKKLIEIGFIEVNKKGLPAKYHFKINDALVINYFNDQCFKKGSTSDFKNEAQNNNKEIINKNNNKEYININENNLVSIFQKAKEDLNNLDLKQEFDRTLLLFLEFRRQIKKPIKDASKLAFLQKLEKLSDGKLENAIEILNESIANGWQGIFPIKNKPKQNTNDYIITNEF